MNTHNRSIVQTILVLAMFGISIALFLLFAMRGRIWWGIAAGLGSYLLLFWLTAPYLAKTEGADGAEPSSKDKASKDKDSGNGLGSHPIYPRPAAKPAPPAEPASPPLAPTSSTSSTSAFSLPLSPSQLASVKEWLMPSSAPEPATELWLAEVVDTHGDAAYGRVGLYTSDLYMGRVAQGAVVQVLSLTVQMTEFNMPVVQVRVLSDPRVDVRQFGTAVWLKIANTTLAPYYRRQQTPVPFDLAPLRAETKRLYPTYQAYQPPSYISQPPTFPKGILTNNHGAALYGHAQGYDSQAYLTRLMADSKLILRSPEVILSEHNTPLVLVEVTAAQSGNDLGAVGWLALTDTTFADYYDPKSKSILVP